MSTINLQNGNTLLSSGSFPPVRVASTGTALNPSTGGLLVVDGVQLDVGDRVLCKDETSAVNNGIYAAQTGPWTRTNDAGNNQQFFAGMNVTVAFGAVNAGDTFRCTSTDDPVVVGTSNITWSSAPPVGGGNVVGPNSSTPGDVPVFADNTGRVLADSAVTGTGPIVKADSPELVTPNLGAATANTINGYQFTTPATAVTLTIASGKTLTALNSIGLAGADNVTLSVNSNLTLGGVNGKTLNINNSLTLAGTDNTVMTFPSASDSVVGVTAAQNLTNKTLTAPIINAPELNGVDLVGGTIDGAVIGGATPAAGTFTSIQSGIQTLTAATVTVNTTTTIFNGTAAQTATLPSATANKGQVLFLKNIAAFAVTSASANVVPLAGGSPGTAIFSAATAGKFAILISDGTNWQIMAQN